MKLSTIPFSGFYETNHDADLDDVLERMFSDDSGDVIDKDRLNDAFWNCNWKQVHESYAKAYAKTFGREFNIPSLKFESLSSPREYNFYTDRIFVEISEEDIQRIWKEMDYHLFAETCKERHTSYEGFGSYYDPDYREWGDIEIWDHNQIGTLMVAWAQQQIEDHHNTDDLNEFLYEMMEPARCNGYLDDWIWNALPDEIKEKLNAESC